jgi:hypothetical protein
MSRPIDLASPNLRKSVPIRFKCEGGSLLGLGRNCLTFEMFLMDVFMADIDLRRGAIIAILSLACSSNVELHGDRSQVIELRSWFAVCFVLS